MLSGILATPDRADDDFEQNVFFSWQTRSLFYIKLIITCKLICKYVSMEGKKDIIAHLGSKCECLALKLSLYVWLTAALSLFFFLTRVAPRSHNRTDFWLPRLPESD